MLGLLGPNGAGKSTSVSLAVGLLAPDSGTVTIEGHGNPADPAVRQKIGVAPQALALYDLLTGEENLRFFGEVYGLSGAALDERVTWCLDFVGLTDRKGDRAGGYSGGMKRRLNLAAAVLHDPELLLLDEPTVGVDPQSRNKIFESIEALHREGRTIIYTTHYMEEAERLCDRIAIIDAGKLLALGTLSELLAAHGGPPTLIVKTNGSEQRAADRRSARRAQSHRRDRRRSMRFQMERPTLEQVFLRLTGRSLDSRETEARCMKQIIALALKDLRLMPRNRGGMFFTFVWPVLVTVLFGIMFGGNERRRAGQDQDRRRRRRQHATARARSSTKLEESFDLSPMTLADAENAVRRGQRTGFIVVKPGFGEASNRMFYGSPKEIEVGVDPARQAEAGMLEGLLMKHAAADMQKMFTDSHGVDARWSTRRWAT